MKIKVFILIVFSALALYATETLVSSLNAKSDSSNIKIEWRSLNESQVARYEIERKSPANNEFKFIGSENPKGSNSYYSFTDETAYKNGETQINSNVYSYRLKIVYSNNNQAYTSSVTAVPNVSSVKRTWGMLKELFK